VGRSLSERTAIAKPSGSARRVAVRLQAQAGQKQVEAGVELVAVVVVAQVGADGDEERERLGVELLPVFGLPREIDVAAGVRGDREDRDDDLRADAGAVVVPAAAGGADRCRRERATTPE
jgi:hypothetical protein